MAQLPTCTPAQLGMMMGSGMGLQECDVSAARGQGATPAPLGVLGQGLQDGLQECSAWDLHVAFGNSIPQRYKCWSVIVVSSCEALGRASADSNTSLLCFYLCAA